MNQFLFFPMTTPSVERTCLSFGSVCCHCLDESRTEETIKEKRAQELEGKQRHETHPRKGKGRLGKIETASQSDPEG